MVALLDTCDTSAVRSVLFGRFIHSLMSGKYAQNREMGSRTVVLP